MADWSQLPPEILHSISKRIAGEVDLIRFRSVCSSWRSSCPLRTDPPGYFHLPGASRGRSEYSFSIERRSVFLVRSPHGGNSWLLKSHTGFDGRKSLYCPLSAYEIVSPFRNRVLDLSDFSVLELGQEYVGITTTYTDHPLEPQARRHMDRVAVIHTGTDNYCFALLARHFHGVLALFRSGDTELTVLRNIHGVTDLASFNGKFYAVDEQGRTFMADQSGNSSLLHQVITSGASECRSRFLVESDNELLLIEMDSSTMDHQEGGLRLQIHKLDVEGNKWDEVKSLGVRVLFLGEVGSFSASASQLGWPRGNFIYVGTGSTKYRNLNVEELGLGNYGGSRSNYVYDFEKGKITCLENCSAELNLFRPPEIWFAASATPQSSSHAAYCNP